MNLTTIRSAGLGLAKKHILLRVAYDVPLKKTPTGYRVADNRRITETIPTIEFLLKKNCSLALLTWVGRPQGKHVSALSVAPIAHELSRLLKRPVHALNDCIGISVARQIRSQKPGDILMLENVRFHHQEEENNQRFAKLLVQGSDVIVFDAFAQAHRVHSSTVGIAKYLPVCAGLLVEKELTELGKVISHPKRPLVVLLGGAKISDKVAVIEHLTDAADKVLVGGALAHVFLKAQNIPIGHSFVEDVFVDKAKRKKINYVKLAGRLLSKYRDRLVLPIDLVATGKVKGRTIVKTVELADAPAIPADWSFVDIGPKTIQLFRSHLKTAKTIFWNGPMGVFENPAFSRGTAELAVAIANHHGVTVVGGGDTEQVVGRYHLEGKFTHVSTGGGASLQFLAGKMLPGLKSVVK